MWRFIWLPLLLVFVSLSIYFMYQSKEGVMLMTIVESNATVLSFIISLVDQIKPITPTNTGDGGMTNYSHRRATNLRTALVSSFFFYKILSYFTHLPLQFPLNMRTKQLKFPPFSQSTSREERFESSIALSIAQKSSLVASI